jgi:lipoprotein-anchoring transpeptidase ErfK/SrfK
VALFGHNRGVLSRRVVPQKKPRVHAASAVLCAVVPAVLASLSATACKKKPTDGAATSASAEASAAPVVAAAASAIVIAKEPREYVAPEGPILGAISGQVNIFASPALDAKRIGYLRLGAMIKRDPEPVGKATCAGGWYRVYPKGYICADEGTTQDANHIILKASRKLRPDRATAMPYRYGFVRAVLPLYLKIPNRDEQLKAEFQLKEHLEKWEPNKDELNKVVTGSYDVPVDERGVPIVGKKAGDVPHPSTTWSQGELFGGVNDDDKPPFWLEEKRLIPNLSDFKVPDYATFADRARRHTGLAFIGSFQMGEDGFNRRFGITTDLRLAPTSKVKPDTGSPWHGLELLDPAKSPPLPFAWVRTTTAKAYKFGDSDRPSARGELDKRTIVMLTGKKRKGYDGDYWELKNGSWLRASEAGVVKQPDEWPTAAKKGLKWIEVSISSQTLILWEGQKPVYATLVSTGRDGAKDPKTTLSTVQGEFTIQSKHITATMDSNEGSGASGGKKPEVPTASRSTREDSGTKSSTKSKSSDASKSKGDSKSDKAKSKAKSTDSKASSAKSDEGKTKSGRDKEYGVTKRRGEGTFWLRDVPYVQYFQSAYALHVAYWHDVFGIARSHGCINLSPIDGRWIFAWTDPPIPDGWHGSVSGPEVGEGTTIIVHE